MSRQRVNSFVDIFVDNALLCRQIRLQVVYMSSKVISFRLSDAEIEALQALQSSDDESLNQTAARLLRGIIGTPSALSTKSTPVDIQELIRREVESAIANSERMNELVRANTAHINEVKRELDERLGELSA
ncbi:MAG: hypothetical protein RM368_33010 [Nostoc sp. DedSLP03]|uniref:hypothetical protein n=1 Tax=Nostoc sp. DedSLP03 TaxID=3075400 RepID=UPI002AD467E3|nr:hypothetical protein [Nostoc sp. DedSLP03]MDZ7969711.1 hypothetical protein [Nostoc sp. DedSLP03]